MTIWCDPPPPTRFVWHDVLEPLLAEPHRWALVREYDRYKSATDAIRALRRSAIGKGHVVIPPGRWEFVQRQIEEGQARWGVWARYLGERS